jgi:putative salt-induced outer membrane protein YdiY
MRSKMIVGILFVAAWNGVAYADEVVFKNGDKLTGKVKQLTEHKLTFESQVAGPVTIDVSKIQTFKTDEAMEIKLADGTSFSKAIAESGLGFVAVMCDEQYEEQEFALDKIMSIEPVMDTNAKWKGDISAGVTATRGNTVTDTSNLSVNFNRRTKNDRTIISGYYIKGEQKNTDTGEKITTEDAWWVKGKYDYFFTKKFYVYGEGRYETDAIANLQSRTILGAGAGRQWIESESMNFSTEGGLASLYERYTNRTNSTDEVSGQLGYHFDRKLNSKVKFFNDLTYYPKLEELSDYFLTTTGEIRTSITERIFTNFKVIFNHDATPAEGARKTDVKYIFGFGWSF